MRVLGILLVGYAAYSSGELCAKCSLAPNPAYSPAMAMSIQGDVIFSQESVDSAIAVTVRANGFNSTSAPTQHGFHVHEFADMSPNGCNSMGGHYNPTSQPHGAPTDLNRHVGDLGNIEISPQGTINKTIQDSTASLFGSHSIIGRSIVIHEGEDDLGLGGEPDSLTTGNAGKRLACCEIAAEDCEPSGAASAPAKPTTALLLLSAAVLAKIRNRL